jgi:hypothetical protein
MGPKPKRYQQQRCQHFITFSCYQRKPLLDSATARETFERELERVRRWYGCYVTGYVVMGAGPTFPIEFPFWGCPTLVALFATGWDVVWD